MYIRSRTTLRIFTLFGFLILGHSALSQHFYPDQAIWLSKAEQLKPGLTQSTRYPSAIVAIEKDEHHFQGWSAKKIAAPDVLYTHPFKQQDKVLLDFGAHLTGFVSFDIKTITGTADAPIRLKVTFGEMPSELATPFDPYPGSLSRAWLQDEVVTVTDLPQTVTIPRRVAFRYMKIELLGSSKYFDFTVSNIVCKAVSSVTNSPAALASSTPPLIKAIDSVGLSTLKECMQTVYEDGPKRDSRLWIGDLYLESLANSYSFKNFDLTKRCLYLLAGLSGEKGFLIGTAFERPQPHVQANQYMYDYALLYNAALKEYFDATHDSVTAKELWPVAKRQLDIIRQYVQPDGSMDFSKASKEWWLFFDWNNKMDKHASFTGISVFALKQTYNLAKELKCENELTDVPGLIKKISLKAKNDFYDRKLKMIVSGTKKQVSCASQVWFTLGGILTQKESSMALQHLKTTTDAVFPGAPYMYHYYVQALINAGLKDDAKEVVSNYWGGMVLKGADTFWEVYDPNNDYLSPYGFFPLNSYCHAWSCTPVYFIRKYPEIFQR